MNRQRKADCLILACGNPLRGDDAAAQYLADLAAQTALGIRILVQQQWTPELAEDIAFASSVLFVDCALTVPLGTATLTQVDPECRTSNFLTHHCDAASLLGIAKSLYHRIPERRGLLLIGAQSFEFGEPLSPAVMAAIPRAVEIVRSWVDESEIAY